jgi:hypothetical protein
LASVNLFGLCRLELVLLILFIREAVMEQEHWFSVSRCSLSLYICHDLSICLSGSGSCQLSSVSIRCLPPTPSNMPRHAIWTTQISNSSTSARLYNQVQHHGFALHCTAARLKHRLRSGFAVLSGGWIVDQDVKVTWAPL